MFVSKALNNSESRKPLFQYGFRYKRVMYGKHNFQMFILMYQEMIKERFTLLNCSLYQFDYNLYSVLIKEKVID